MKYPSWFVPLAGNAHAPARLFAFPYSGGSAASYASWKEWIPSDIELLGVQLPGRSTRMAEPVIADMETLLDELVPPMLPLLYKPYQLFGHSNGALMAFAVANRLARLGARLPERIILSGKRSPTVAVPVELLSTLPEAQLLDKLRELNGTPKEFLDDLDVMRLFLPCMRGDFALGESFRLKTVHPALAALPALLLAGEDDRMPAADVLAWRDIFPRGQGMVLKGDHFFINTDPLFPETVIGFLRGGPLGAAA